jgi:mono/diheme cytochrome c family protein
MDENWGYADHQIEHIIEAMEDGLKRRPIRAASSEEFMEQTLPYMEALVEKKDKEEFLKGFQIFTSACNACHAKEGESAIMIQTPLNRTSPVRF